jgi:predicted transcriptional regulator
MGNSGNIYLIVFTNNIVYNTNIVGIQYCGAQVIENLLGNKTLEKILLSVERYGQIYSSDIAKTFNIPVYSVQKQLAKMELSGVLVSRLYGKVRLYQFNPSYPLLKELKALLSKTFTFLPKTDIEKYYMRRRRPRFSGKPL